MDEAKLPPISSTKLSSDEEIRALRAQVAQLAARVEALERQSSGARVTAPSKPKLESRFGLTLVNRAGALTLAIGIIFFFKYAADNRWIGAEGRVVLGVLAGLAMLAGAEWLRRRDRSGSSVFTQGVAGCGLATIYAAVYAAFAYYELLLPAAGWIFLVLVSAVGVLLSIRYHSAAMAALGFTGGLLTPMLLHNTATAWWFDFFYLLLLGLTSLGIALRQHWLLLVPGLAGLTLLAAGVSFESHHPGWFVLFAFLLAAVHFAAARRFGNYAYLTAHGALLIAAMRLVALWSTAGVEAADRFSFTSALDSFLLAIYGIAALVYGMRFSSLVNRALGLFLLGIVIAKLYLWDVWQLSKFYRISAFVLLGVLLLAASYAYSRFRSRTSG